MLISHEFPPDSGGAGVVAYQNAIAMSSANVNVTVLTRNQCFNHQPYQNLNYILYPCLKNFWPFFLILYIKRIKLINYDLIILNDSFANLVFGSFIKNREILNKTISYLHGGEVYQFLTRPGFYARLLRFKSKYLNFLSNVQKIISVSYEMKIRFIKQTSFKYEDKIVVVYSGVDDNIFRYKYFNLKRHLNLNIDKTILLTVSRLVHDKGFSRMIDIFSQIVSRNPNFHWIIIGDGPYLQDIISQLKQKSLFSNVSIIGYVMRQELPLYYSNSDIFWLLSPSESFGLVYLEAQMCGCPVIGNNIDGVNEAITDQTSGFLINSNEECIKLITNYIFNELDQKSIIDCTTSFKLSHQIKELIHILD